MKLVILGLTISSSWGNGHATLWRGLCRALIRRGHDIVFFERDVPYYATHRDLSEIPAGQLCLYGDWAGVRTMAAHQLGDADVAIVTSYCPDGISATELVLDSATPISVFYDLDTPVTLDAVRSGRSVDYIGLRGLAEFDLVLSYTGGSALTELRETLGARRVAPLYGSVDPEVHRPVPPVATYRADLSYLGTYAEDRQSALETLFLEPARRLPDLRFLIGGALYPHDFPWTDNIFFRRHVPPQEHPAFFCSSTLTLNVTRATMASMGFCPSGRLFEAAACGVPILSDEWEGLDEFFTPDAEILVAGTAEEAIEAVQRPRAELARVAHAARERTLAEHTSDQRAGDLEAVLESVGGANGPASAEDGNLYGSRATKV